MKKLMYVAISVQSVAIAIFFLIPFGFDHPSSYGLDFGDLIILVNVHGMALIIGVVASLRLRRHGVAVAQILMTVLVVFIAIFDAFLPSSSKPHPPDLEKRAVDPFESTSK